MSDAKIEKYARMANQIGDYFAARPPEEGAAGFAAHIEKFWTPKMIAEMLDAFSQGKVALNETSAKGFAIVQQQLTTAD